jgi:tetratricopeptide (TPR) repeat protein
LTQDGFLTLLSLPERWDELDADARGLHALLTARIAQWDGEFEDTERALRQAQTEFDRATGTRGAWGRATSTLVLAELYMRTARLDDAESTYRSAVSMYAAMPDGLGVANAHAGLGELYMRQARLEEAEATYQEAGRDYRAIQHRQGEASSAKALGDVYTRRSLWERAEQAYVEAQVTFRSVQSPLGEANVHLALGELYAMRDRLDEAEAEYKGLLHLSWRSRTGTDLSAS